MLLITFDISKEFRIWDLPGSFFDDVVTYRFIGVDGYKKIIIEINLGRKMTDIEKYLLSKNDTVVFIEEK